MQDMSAASSVFAVYQARFSILHPKLLWAHWKSRATFCTHRVKTLHLDAGAPIPSRMQHLSSHPLCLQVMFSLTQQDPPCQVSSARSGGSCDLELVMDLPELITQSCRALLRCAHLLPNSAEAGVRTPLWTQHGAHWSSSRKPFISPWLAQIALLFKDSRLFKILSIIICSLKLPNIQSSERVKIKSCKMLSYASRDQLIKETEKLTNNQTVKSSTSDASLLQVPVILPDLYTELR